MGGVKITFGFTCPLSALGSVTGVLYAFQAGGTHLSSQLFKHIALHPAFTSTKFLQNKHAPISSLEDAPLSPTFIKTLVLVN